MLACSRMDTYRLEVFGIFTQDPLIERECLLLVWPRGIIVSGMRGGFTAARDCHRDLRHNLQLATCLPRPLSPWSASFGWIEMSRLQRHAGAMYHSKASTCTCLCTRFPTSRGSASCGARCPFASQTSRARRPACLTSCTCRTRAQRQSCRQCWWYAPAHYGLRVFPRTFSALF